MLPKAYRLTKAKDFQNVTKKGVRVHSDIATIYAILNPVKQKNFTLGLIVSKVVGNSVVRHKVSRQLRNIVKEITLEIPQNIDLVIRTTPKFLEKTFEENKKTIKENILKVISKTNV